MEPFTLESFPIDEAFPPGCWNEFLWLYQEQASIFHTREWMLTLKDAFGFKPMVLMAMGLDGGTFFAAIPYMVQSAMGFTIARSMPFDTYGGPIGSPEYFDALEKGFLNLDHTIRRVVDFRKFGDVSTEIVDLTPNLDDIWFSVNKKTRTAIRNAATKDVEIYPAGKYVNIMDKVSGKIMESLWKNMVPPGKCTFMIAELNNEVVAESVYFHYGNEAMYWANTVTPEGRAANANHLMMWEEITTAKKMGCKTLNLGASPDGADSLVKFKKSWGSKTHPYSRRQEIFSLRRLFHG